MANTEKQMSNGVAIQFAYRFSRLQIGIGSLQEFYNKRLAPGFENGYAI
jgi:hypothetical protein